MRSEIRRALIAIIFCCLGILTSCGDNASKSPTPAPAQLTLNPPALTYSAIVGDAPYTVTVTATKGAPVTSDTFAVSSSNPSVATVVLNGTTAIISPVAAGTANITFTTGSGITRTIAATIAPDQTSLTLSPSSLTYSAIAGDAPYNVTVTSTKKDGVTPGTFTVSSSNTAVATAVASGNVVTITPVAAGTANIVFKSSSNTSVTRTIVATIAPDQTQINLSPSALTYTASVGDAPYNVTVSAVKNDGVTPDTFNAVSSNPAVAGVTVSGNVVSITPVAAGTANIVISSGSEPKVKKTIAATISAAVPTPSLTLSPSSTTVSTAMGTPYQVTVTALKNDGVTPDTFTTSSDNTGVASVSPSNGSSGGVVTITPVAPGTANISITSSTGLSSTIALTVTPSTKPTITLSPASATYTAVAGSAPRTVTVTALKADGVTSDTFTVASDNSAAASVSPTSGSNGSVITITPVAPGTANITFTSTTDSTVKATIVATITAPSVSGCDGTEWFCDDFQSETIGSSTVANWDLTKFGNNAAFTVTSDPIVPANTELQYYAGTSSLDIVPPGQVIALIKDSVWANIPNKSNYYFEARIKPQNNSKTASKMLYMIARYQDANNWYFGGMNLQSSPRVEAGYMKGATVTAVSKTNVSLVQGTQGGNDGQWYKVRYEVIGGVQTLYLDGVQMGAPVNDTDFTSGKVGLFTYNKSFLIDDIKIGAVQLILSPNANTYTAAAGSGPYVVNVTAVLPDGVTSDTYTVTSSDPTVATAAIDGTDTTKTNITPLAVGTATITFASTSNPKVTRTIVVTVTTPVVVKPTISVSPSGAYTAAVGGAADVVTVTALKGDSTADTFTVSSSAPAIASVSPTSGSNGTQVTITPLAVGNATITFTSGSDSSVTATIAVTVTPAPKPTISVSPSTAYTVAVGGTADVVTVTALKGDSTADTFTVSSSAPAVASVSPVSGPSGAQVTITPLTVGNATITFTSGSDSTVTTTIAVTVTAAPKPTISVSPSTAYSSVVGGAADVVTVTATKADGTTADTFTVGSSDSSVASVSPSSGPSGTQVTISPLAVGNATITFTSGSDASVTATIAVTVTAQPKPTISVSPSTAYTAAAGGAADVVTVTAIKADGTTADTFAVASSDSSVASVSPASGPSGSEVTIAPLAVGNATITFTSGSDASVTATIAVTVTPNASAVKLTPPTASYSSNVGGTPHIVIISAVKPDGTTPDSFTVSADDNGTVVNPTVTDDQLTLNPVGVGTSHITITSGAGKTAAITLTVNSAVSHCDGTEWFCDDFQKETVGNNTVANWDLNTAPGGIFTVVQDADNTSNTALQYNVGTQSSGAMVALIKDTVWANVAPHLNATGDYYVEAHLKPQEFKSNKLLYIVSHYVSATNWYGGGYNYNGPRLELGSDLNGTLAEKYKQGTSPWTPTSNNGQLPTAGVQGAGAGKEGTWVTVRFEVINGVATMYANGVADPKLINQSFTTVLTTGKIGLFNHYDNFLIDDIRVGDPSVKPAAPAQLSVKSSLGASVAAYASEVGDAPSKVVVTALKGNGTADTYYVASSNPAVVTATVDPADATGATVILSPVSAGTANIAFFSASDPNVSVVIPATIGPRFVQPTTTYTLSNGQLLPAPGASAAYVDDRLVLTFDAPPTLGTSGSVRIFQCADEACSGDPSTDTRVDVIQLTGETEIVGPIGPNYPSYSGNVRGVKASPIWVSNNSVVIAPHQSKLAYNTKYYVAISDGAIDGVLSGQNFTGIGKNGGWMFTTKAAPSAGLTTLNVSASGTSADFRTVQGALNYAMQNASTYTAATPLTINVASGTYQEMLFLRNVSNVTINGAGQSQTTIQYENYESLNGGSGGSSSASAPSLTGGRSVFLVEGSDMLTLTNLTLKNTHLRKLGINNQAETIYFNSDSGRLIAKNSEFDSEQDTLLLKGYNWFYQTLVTGNVDYIWGYSHAALFENSEIRTVGDSSAAAPSGGYLVQARPASLTDKGFVFLNSSLTYGTGPGGQVVADGTNATASTYLARSGGGSGAYDNVLYIGCRMGTHIAPLGWAAPGINNNPNPTPATATATSGWREYGSVQMDGTTPLDVSQRTTPYSYQMTSSDLTTYGFDTRANIFSAYPGGWNPQP